MKPNDDMSSATIYPTESPRPGRPADRQELIVAELRQLIVDGNLEPGSRLPTRPEIEARYGAGTSTVQRALDQLKRDGFISSHGRNGTTVVENPPHLTRYALIFSDQPTYKVRINFWPALANEAMALEKGNPFDMPLFYGINGSTDAPDYRRLMQEIKQHRIAGLIFPAWPYPLERDPLMHSGVPIAVVGGNNANVRLDGGGFWDRACEHLAARGRKRVACVTAGDGEDVWSAIDKAARNTGLETRRYWWQIHNNRTPVGTVNCVHLLFHKDQAVRPDALIVSDDNLVEAATQGLKEAGLRAPEDVDVIAHSNFPWSTPASMPVTRLGYHAKEILLLCIDQIDAARRQESIGHVYVPARFEGEFEALQKDNP